MKRRTDYSTQGTGYNKTCLLILLPRATSNRWLETSSPYFIIKSGWSSLVCPPAVLWISHQGSAQQPVTCVWSVGQSVITTNTAAATGLRLIWLMVGQSNLPVFELLYSSCLQTHTHKHTHMHARWQKHTAHIDLQAGCRRDTIYKKTSRLHSVCLFAFVITVWQPSLSFSHVSSTAPTSKYSFYVLLYLEPSCKNKNQIQVLFDSGGGDQVLGV